MGKKINLNAQFGILSEGNVKTSVCVFYTCDALTITYFSTMHISAVRKANTVSWGPGVSDCSLKTFSACLQFFYAAFSSPRMFTVKEGDKNDENDLDMSGKEVTAWQWDVNSSLLMKFIHLTVCSLSEAGEGGKRGRSRKSERDGERDFFMHRYRERGRAAGHGGQGKSKRMTIVRWLRGLAG